MRRLMAMATAALAVAGCSDGKEEADPVPTTGRAGVVAVAERLKDLERVPPDTDVQAMVDLVYTACEVLEKTAALGMTRTEGVEAIRDRLDPALQGRAGRTLIEDGTAALCPDVGRPT